MRKAFDGQQRHARGRRFGLCGGDLARAAVSGSKRNANDTWLLAKRARAIDVAPDPHERFGTIGVSHLEEGGDVRRAGVEDEPHELVPEKGRVHGHIDGGGRALEAAGHGIARVADDGTRGVEANRRHARHEMERRRRDRVVAVLMDITAVRRERLTGGDDDLAPCGRVADGGKDARRAFEVRDGSRDAIGGGHAACDTRGLSKHLEWRVWIAEHGLGHQSRAIAGAAGDGEPLGAKQPHPLEKMPVGHLLDTGNGIERQRGALIRARSAKEPPNTSQGVPEAVVRVAIIKTR